MKNILIVMLIALPLIGCSASIGTPPTTTTTYATPATGVSTTTYTSEPVHKTTVTRTTY